MKKIYFVAILIVCLTVACQKNEDSRNGREIKFPTYEKTTVDFLDTIPVTMPGDFSKSDFAAFSVTVESGLGSGTSVVTKSSTGSKAWEIETLAPVFDGSGKMTKNPCIVIKRIPMDGSDAVLTASLIGSDGGRTNTSVVVSSADYSDLEGKWEEFSDEIINLGKDKIIEMICWYMYFLHDAEGQEEFSDDILEFVNNHKRLLLASKYTDLQDEEIAGDVDYWKNLLENQEVEDAPETTLNEGEFNHLQLDDRTLLCHTTLPCASKTLAYHLSRGDEISSLKIPGIAKDAIVRMFTFQNAHVTQMFQEGVRVFDFQLINEGGLRGNTLLCPGDSFWPHLSAIADMVKTHPSEFAIVIISASVKQTIKDLLGIIVDDPKKDGDYYDLLDLIHKSVAEFMAKPENKKLFVPFRANMTVGDARGHIIVMWGDEWEDDTTVKPFGAVINKPDEGYVGSIQTWNSETEDWEDEAELMYNDMRFLGERLSSDAKEAAGREVASKMSDFDQKNFRRAVMKLDPVPIWCIHRADCVMTVKMPSIPWLLIKIFGHISIDSYPNAAWTTQYVNRYVAEYFKNPYQYKARQYGPSGIVYMYMTATENCNPPLFGSKNPCYGIEAVRWVSMNQPRMPYLQRIL